MKIVPSGRKGNYLARFGVFLTTVALIAGIVGCNLFTPPSNKLEIRTWYDLDAIRGNLTGSYILMADLNFGTPGYDELASPTANQGKGWQPIGTRDNPFLGSFEGPGAHGTPGYLICDLFINRPNEDDIGLFGAVGGSGVIKDLDVANITVVGKGAVGSVAGFNGGTLSNLVPTASVTGNLSVGGLAGVNEGTVTRAYSLGDVTGGESVGGLLGVNGNSGPGTLSNSVSHGKVTGDSCVGGLVGVNNNQGSSVSNSYSTGSVAGSSSVGGLIGLNDGSAVIDCYSIGNVTGSSRVGGLAGFNIGGTVTSSFWDIQTSGQTTSRGGTGRTTAEMQDIETFAGAGWDIVNVRLGGTNTKYIWNIVKGMMYPYLSQYY
jgi:hypothetical protein